MSWAVLLLGFAVLQSCGKANEDADAASGGVAGGEASGGAALGGAVSGGGSGTGNDRGGSSGMGGSMATGGATSGDGGAGDSAAGAAGELGLGGGAGAGSGGRSGSGGGINVLSGGSAGGVSKCSASIASPAEPVQPVLEFLVDTSASMAKAEPFSTYTKYHATRDALSQAFTEMVEGTGAGLIFFPNLPNTTAMPCIVRQEAVPIASLNAELRQALIQALAAKQPSGSTPTHDAVRYALEKLDAATLDGPKYLVLLTDGAPTYALGCTGDGMSPVDSAPLLAEIQQALLFGIHTFVIGSPGSEEARGTLSRMATLGGTAPSGCSDQGPNYCHFDMTVTADLAVSLNAALQTITASTVSCSYRLPAVPALDRSLVNVAITAATGASTTIPYNSAAQCTDGWHYSSNADRIQLCPNTCDTLKANPGAKVELIIGCKMITL